jgi:hypothetical protein
VISNKISPVSLSLTTDASINLSSPSAPTFDHRYHRHHFLSLMCATWGEIVSQSLLLLKKHVRCDPISTIRTSFSINFLCKCVDPFPPFPDETNILHNLRSFLLS